MSASVNFHLADPVDNPEVLRLLRENWVGGRYPLSLEREPDAFAAVAPYQGQAFVLATAAATGEAVGLCERVVRPAFINGRVERLPYLTALRVARSHRNRIAVLKGGFRMLRERATIAGDFPCALTSITADNDIAKRVLTAGLKGLPTYRPVGPYSTLVMRPRRTARDPAISLAGEGDLGEIATFLQRELIKFQFAPVWSEAELRRIGAEYLVHRTDGRIDGCVSLWDQSATRQAVVRGYPRGVQLLRPVINAAAPFLGLPHLPPTGSVIPQAFLSHLAVTDDEPEIMLSLIKAGLDLARRRRLGAATIGMSSHHRFNGVLRKHFRAIQYQTLLYLVHWEDGAEAAAGCDGRLPMPDVGLL
jgi:hypothetical protein